MVRSECNNFGAGACLEHVRETGVTWLLLVCLLAQATQRSEGGRNTSLLFHNGDTCGLHICAHVVVGWQCSCGGGALENSTFFILLWSSSLAQLVLAHAMQVLDAKGYAQQGQNAKPRFESRVPHVTFFIFLVCGTEIACWHEWECLHRRVCAKLLRKLPGSASLYARYSARELQ